MVKSCKDQLRKLHEFYSIEETVGLMDYIIDISFVLKSEFDLDSEVYNEILTDIRDNMINSVYEKTKELFKNDFPLRYTLVAPDREKVKEIVVKWYNYKIGKIDKKINLADLIKYIPKHNEHLVKEDYLESWDKTKIYSKKYLDAVVQIRISEGKNKSNFDVIVYDKDGKKKQPLRKRVNKEDVEGILNNVVKVYDNKYNSGQQKEEDLLEESLNEIINLESLLEDWTMDFPNVQRCWKKIGNLVAQMIVEEYPETGEYIVATQIFDKNTVVDRSWIQDTEKDFEKRRVAINSAVKDVIKKYNLGCEKNG